MVTKLYRVIKFGAQNFWRNRLLSIATLSVMLLALLVFQGLILFNIVAKTAIDTLQEKIDISVYFKTTAPEDDILQIRRTLEGFTEVKTVEYVSREKALEIFKTRHEEDSVVSQAVEELDENPFSASLNIKAHDPEQYGTIAAYLENDAPESVIDSISYSQNQVVIDRLAKIVSIGRQGGLLLTIILTVIAILVVFNTILIAIYSNREEIGIMRLVGASNAFIRGPYLFEGVLYGLIAGIVSIILITPLVFFTSPFLEVFIPGMELKSYFGSHLFSLLGYQILFGVIIGIISSFIAVRKYLKV